MIALLIFRCTPRIAKCLNTSRASKRDLELVILSYVRPIVLRKLTIKLDFNFK
jgi:hypothetical protein